jgi:integrase
MSKTKITMQSRVRAYLAQRRALGYGLRIEGQLLLNFARFADRSGHCGPPTKDLMLRWATLPTQADPLYKARRLEIVGTFAKHQVMLEPLTELPPRHVLGPAHRRKPAHLFTAGQIYQLLARAGKKPGKLRSHTYRTLIGLLTCSGLRISEALALNLEDVDWEHGVLTIRESKYRLTRLVPLHPSALAALKRYDRKRQRFYHQARPFFLSEQGDRLAYSTVRTAFRKLTADMVPASGRRYVRLHDLRHTFACRVLLRWERSKGRALGRLAILSRYLGHAHVTDTYWYLTATPALLAEASRNFQLPPL